MSDARTIATAFFWAFLLFVGGIAGFRVNHGGLDQAIKDRDAALKDRNAVRREMDVCREEVRRLVQVRP